ncbi:hypothetical protein [Gluconobacter wancherniae]|uniref:hypothetical protein n=1 Tax=Gluconobacter wancherniae TaxID=1307955 RepID=UPI001B8B4D54|nr:hypothetical protein [Gluconobacter wancherniae]MBS1087591.1 hypothetical protein [Gluconobacter wancherniae]
MTNLPAHWQYIAASYALTLGCSAFLAISAMLRLRRSKARLAAVERHSRRRGTAA